MTTRSDKRASAAGFTLTELLVVLGIIALAMAIVLPSIVPLLLSSTASQVRAVVSALLGAARGMAIERQSYALVHFQMSPDEKCWAAVLIYEIVRDPQTGEPTGHRFVPVEGYAPRKMPGGIALGEVSDNWLDSGQFRAVDNDVRAPTAWQPQPNWELTTFNVIFGPDGSLAQMVPGTDGNLVVPNIHTGSRLFTDPEPDVRIWDFATGPTLQEQGVRMMVAFPYKDVKNLSVGDHQDPTSRAHYLQNNGEYFVINPYTGQLLPSE